MLEKGSFKGGKGGIANLKDSCRGLRFSDGHAGDKVGEEFWAAVTPIGLELSC
jgi:hypothetical protein